MSRSRRRRIPVVTLLLASALAAVGCINRSRVRQPAPDREWTETIGRAQAAVEAGRFAAADTLLAAFAERWADSDEANETIFWRAVFRLDPANPEASPARAVSELTTYLARPGGHSHLAEARALRRAASLADSLAGAPRRAASADASAADKDAEIARLREELKRATDELERIKRRLSTPTP